MKTETNWDKYVKQQMKDPVFKKAFDDEIQMLQIGLQLAEQRKRQGLTQAEVAKRIGTSAPQLCRTERRPERANMTTLRKYADALGMDLDVKLIAKR